MSTDTGKNLLSPGKTPKTNLLFLTTFVNVIAAVAKYSDVLRAAIASAGNDHRLGANEAPPAIISVFIGKALTHVLNDVAEKVSDTKSNQLLTEDLKLHIHNQIPDILLDNTDRNRTSPFAFTGNKFEIRATGSSANCSSTMVVINTIVADQFLRFKNDVEALIAKEGEKKEGAIMRVLKHYIMESQNILFEGDNYSQEWADEAEKRGLKNVRTTPYALDFWMVKENVDVFARHGVLSEREMEARYDIFNHNYLLKVQIEGRLIGELCVNNIIPAAIQYQNNILDNILKMKSAGFDASMYKAQSELVVDLSNHLAQVKSNVDAMIEARKVCNKIEENAPKAKAYCDQVVPFFDKIRYHADKLEQLVDNQLWPLPKYREILSL
jgi:glutamine synthetase